MKKAFHHIVLLVAILITNITLAQGWVNIPTPISSNLIIYDIRFPDDQSSIGYAGGSNYTYNGKARVMKTTDGGLTWNTILESTVNKTGILCMDFTSINKGLAGTMNGDLLVTTDGGQNWTTKDIDPSVNEGEIDVIEFFDANNGILNTLNQGTYTTTDGGATWTRAVFSYSGILDICYATSDLLFACGSNQKIYKSTNKGQSWTLDFIGQNSSKFNLGVHFYDDMNGMVSSEHGQVFVTNNGGITWTSRGNSHNGPMHDVLMHTPNHASMVTNPGQVFTTSDRGATWVSDSSSHHFFQSFYKIIQLSDGTQLVCGSGSDGGTILRKAAPPASVKEMQRSIMEVYPNPASGHIIMDKTLDADLQIFNSTGQLIWSGNTIKNQSKQLDISSWNSGIYTLVSISSNGRESIRFVKE